jgi:hypothetical protein
MALFRDRRVFPRWSFIDSRSLPRPRHARDDNSPASVVSPPEPPAESISAPEVVVEATRQPVSVAVVDSPTPVVQAAVALVPIKEPGGPQAGPQRAIVEVSTVSWIEERRTWLAQGEWPTEASQEAVQLAATHPVLPYTAPLHAGLPTESPAEVRARHGRGFSSPTRRHRLRRHHAHEPAQRRTDIDLVAVEAALDAAADSVGDGLVHVVVWHATTGLALASRGDAPLEVAPVWDAASRDVRTTLHHADLPDAGSYHLVGLADDRLAVLVHAHPDLGACVTVDLHVVAVHSLMATVVPQLIAALSATSREY